MPDADIAPLMGAVGSAFDHAMMASFWGRIQVEPFNRCMWKTRLEVASAIDDYIELWHNTRRRHSAPGLLAPSEVEAAWWQMAEHMVPEAGSAMTAAQMSVDETQGLVSLTPT